jgi:flagellar basal-body rod protein FlgF
MERLVHVTSNALRMQAENQRLIAAGLANQNTVGFKRDYGNIASAYFDGEDQSARVYSTRSEAAVDLEPGKTISSDNPLDVSIDGAGFFAARKDNGDNVITRRGDFKVGQDRLLRNGENVILQGDAGPITVPPNESVQVSRDGQVLVRLPGQEPNAPPTVVGRLLLVNPPAANVRKGEDGLMRTRDGAVPQADANVVVNNKSLETSNINSIDQMVEMLSSSRTFEISVKLLATTKELDDQTARLMRSDR